MKEVASKLLIREIKSLIVQASTVLRDDVLSALKAANKKETTDNGKKVFSMLIENAAIAKEEGKAICQDTGYVDVYFSWPSGLALKPDLQSIVDEAVAQSYEENHLRNSIVYDPLFERKNTQDNTPANICIEATSNKKLTIEVIIKGAGSDNSSALFMLSPTATVDKLIDRTVSHAKEYAAKSCPPLIIGLGIGSSFNKVATLSKKALLRRIDEENIDKNYARVEKEILSKVNALGVGPSGLGGDTTALAVLIEEAPTHMASLPVAINMNCYALRTAKTVISD